MKKPIIIVGAGIAGLSIAFRLEERKIPYMILDSGVNHSSRIAAGIINPVVFRRMALSWRIADFLPIAKGFYTQLEKEFGLNIIHSIPIRRAFAHEQERDLWLKKQDEEAYLPFLKKLDESDDNFDLIQQRCGTGVVKESYWIDTKVLLDKWQEKLQKEGKLIVEKVNYSKINYEESTYMLENNSTIVFDKVIFCEGYHGLENPYFSYLPLQATKGELLTVKNEYLLENESYNYKCFVLPIGNHKFKVGATYAWNSPNVIQTEEAKEELENHFKNIVSTSYNVVNHEAGVRPTVLDRRPLLGAHPTYKNLFIYNGLGAKGYLIAPQLSSEFIAHLFDNEALDKEVNIKRYEKLIPQQIN